MSGWCTITLIIVLMVCYSKAFTAKEMESFQRLEETDSFSGERMNRDARYGADFERGIDEIMEKLEECRRYPGLTAAVVSPRIGVWTKGYGKRSYTTNRGQITRATNFQIQELTRSFTAVLLVIVFSEFNSLNNENKTYTFDTKIKDILGGDYELPSDYMTAEVTVKDLLASRVGFKEQFFWTAVSSYSPLNISREQMCKNLKYASGNDDFRDGSSYNHYNWMLLGHIAEKITNTSWESLVNNRILNPAGMTRARIWTTSQDVFKRNSVDPLWVDVETNMYYQRTSVEYQNGRFPFEPSLGLILSANDMAIWMYILLNGGIAPNGNTIFDSELYLDTFKPSNYLPTPILHRVRPYFPVSEDKTAVALPWIQGNYRGFAFESLEGISYFGTSASMMIFRNLNVGIFVASSGPGKSGFDLYEKVLYPVLLHLTDVAIGLPPFYTESNACNYPFYNDPRDKISQTLDEMKHRKRNVVDDASLIKVENGVINLSKTLGIYTHPLYGSISIIDAGFPFSAIWYTSIDVIGLVDLFYVVSDYQPASFRWLVPDELSDPYVYSIPGAKFQNIVKGTYQTLILDDVTYTKSYPLRLQDNSVNDRSIAEKITTLLNEEGERKDDGILFR